MSPKDLKQTGNWQARAKMTTQAEDLVTNAHCLFNQVNSKNYYEAAEILKGCIENIEIMKSVLDPLPK